MQPHSFSRSPAAGLALAAGAALLALLSAFAGTRSFTSLGGALVAYAPMAAAIARQYGVSRPFGWPNTVTLVRALLACVLAGEVLAAALFGGRPNVLLLAAMASLALASDAVDGVLARRSATTSAFGARFDMEVDAFLILVLSVMVWVFGLAGAWVLLIGLMRYAFVAAGAAIPALTAPLPPSLRRKTVCVLQSLALIASLLAGPAFAPAIAGVALLALTASFAADTVYLLSRKAATPGI